MSQAAAVEEWFERRTLTLDLAELSHAARRDGSMFLGGSAAQYVQPDDPFGYDRISTVVFNWGDPHVPDVFSKILAHDDRPASGLIPFAAATVVGNWLWDLTPQQEDFDPEQVDFGKRGVMELPFDAGGGSATLAEYANRPLPLPHLIGKVGVHWMRFGMAIALR